MQTSGPGSPQPNAASNSAGDTRPRLPRQFTSRALAARARTTVAPGMPDRGKTTGGGRVCAQGGQILCLVLEGSALPDGTAHQSPVQQVNAGKPLLSVAPEWPIRGLLCAPLR